MSLCPQFGEDWMQISRKINFSGTGLIGFGRVGNSDNRANSAQVQMNLPIRAELGNIELYYKRREKKIMTSFL
jgi:hypothetical protein